MASIVHHRGRGRSRLQRGQVQFIRLSNLSATGFFFFDGLIHLNGIGRGIVGVADDELLPDGGDPLLPSSLFIAAVLTVRGRVVKKGSNYRFDKGNISPPLPFFSPFGEGGVSGSGARPPPLTVQRPGSLVRPGGPHHGGRHADGHRQRPDSWGGGVVPKGGRGGGPLHSGKGGTGIIF